LCMICEDRPPSCVVLPCAHLGFCRTCLEVWYKSNRICPFCRADPSSFKCIIEDV
jgi:hypothetical protein